MKRFRFRLEKLLTMRKNAEEARKNELAAVVSKYNREDLERAACFSRIKENAAVLDTMNIGDILSIVQNADMFAVALKKKAESHEKNMQTLSVDIRKKQVLVAEAMRQRRAVELLREKAMREYRKEIRGEEQKILDDHRPRTNVISTSLKYRAYREERNA
ncbi:MAG: flagellar export protein FliJ [Spirochaetota bacterium]